MFWKKSKISDKALIKGIKATGAERQRHENYLFDTHTYLIRNGIKKHRLQEEEAVNAYSDAVLVVLKNIETGRFKGGSTIKTYLTGIFFRKCVDLIRQKTTKQLDVLPIDDFFHISDRVKSVLETLILKEKVTTITSKLEQLGEKCYAILEKWALGYSDLEIMQMPTLKLKNAATVKATRHRCLKKLKAL